MKRLILLMVVLVVFQAESNDSSTKTVSIEWDSVKLEFKIIHDRIVKNWVAWATFTDQTYDNGWSFLKVVTNVNYPDKDQAYAAGLAEGVLTSKKMHEFWDGFLSLLCDPLTGSNEVLCDQTWAFLNENKKWMEIQINNSSEKDPYWHQVSLMLNQIQGIQDGCQDKSFIENSDNALFQEFGFWLYSVFADVSESLFPKFNFTLDHVHDHQASCSVLIKLLPNNSDLYVAHATWVYYTTMIRILKNYEFYFHFTDNPNSPIVPGFNITFSSYPGAIQSTDDYYLISSGLATLETTLNIYDANLLEYIQPQSVLEGFRVMLANRLATDGEIWTTLFAEFNSGTYNNQWMIVNYNLFEPGCSNLTDGLLWIIEQIPGHCEAGDVTSVLEQNGYWASYNIPYFEKIYNLTDQIAVVDKCGPIFGSYDDYFRALMFKRGEDTVVDMKSMIKIMRYNDYENDPFSICLNCTPKHNANMAIAARADLNPVGGTYLPGLGHSAFGATDAKITNYEMFQTLQFIACGGPTHDQQPPFQWSTYDSEGLEIKHPGQPNIWNFTPIVTIWN